MKWNYYQVDHRGMQPMKIGGVSDRRKGCYAGGEFRYTSKEQLIDFCAEHLANENWPAKQVRAHMEAVVPNLKHWK